MMVDVHFLTSNREVFKYAKIEGGVKYIPDWFKNLKSQIVSHEVDGGVFYTMKTCPGFIGLYKKSFMIPLWSDVNISLAEDGSNYASWYAPNKDATMEAHHPIQFDGFASGEWQHLKFECPWYVKSSKPLDFCFLEPVWNGIDETKNIRILPGIVGSQKSHSVRLNVNTMIKREEQHEIYQLKLGTPFCHIVPMTDEKINIKHHLVDEAEIKKEHSPFLSRLKFQGVYDMLKERVSKNG